MNCCVVPAASETLDGVTATDTSAAGVTVREAVPLIDPAVARIVVVPGLTLVARPFDPEASLIGATLVFDELQATTVVRS